MLVKLFSEGAMNINQARRILFVLGLSVMASCNAFAHEAAVQQDQISVVGVGEVEAEPDQVILRVCITATEPSLAAAKTLVDRRYRQVLDVFEQQDIDEKWIKATQISAQPQYDWQNNKRVYKGERVSRSLNITINDLEKVSPLMQALVENGVSSIDGFEAGFQDRAKLLEQALSAAADDARRKAQFLAERLGRNLGAAFLINEHNEHAPTMVRGQEMARASAMVSEAPPPEMFGTQAVRARINVSFYLL
jgi:uncharacterized protein YggE